MTTAETSDAETNLMWAVQALAQPCYVQVRLYPLHVVVADELVVEHEKAQSLFKAPSDPTPAQARALTLLETHIESMSNMNRPASNSSSSRTTAPCSSWKKGVTELGALN